MPANIYPKPAISFVTAINRKYFDFKFTISTFEEKKKYFL
jgi:hypothetical protein